MIYIKKLKQNERVKIQAVEVLPHGKEVMLPMFFLGDFCITPMAKIITKGNRPDPKKMAELLRKWYQRTTMTYSEGIYSFARKGRTKRQPGELYYRYLKREIDIMLSESQIKEEYAHVFQICNGMWEKGYEKYRDTYFWSYHFLHGDLHTGNIVTFRGEYYLIDWESLRSGPKEIEIAFYTIWEYLQQGETYRTLEDMLQELAVFVQENVITEAEKERILYCLIPMWMLIMVVYLNNGNLMFEEERKKTCDIIIPRYKEYIFDRKTLGVC